MAATTSAPSHQRASTPWRLLAGAVPTILAASLLAGTASWLARVPTARDAPEALLWWVQAWGSFALWAAVVTVPAVVLLGWPLDRLLAGRRPLRAASAFAALGLVVGAAVGYAVLASLDAGWVGAATIAPVGGLAAFSGRLLVEPLAARRTLLGILAGATLALVVIGAASP